MGNDNILLSSKTIELSETDTYIELTNRVCFYDEANLNKVRLVSEGALEKAQTLIDMPVVAHYTTSNGKPTFKGHECYIDEDGDLCFDTDNIGTHISVEIKDDIVDVDGVEKTLPCLFAKYKIWKRKKNVVSAVKRLYEEEKLYSSWEIATISYDYKNGVKTLTDYVFLSNCLLGYEYAFPAYGKSAKAISMSSDEPLLMVAEALSKDIILNKEDNLLDEKENSGVPETVESETLPEVEISALTDFDIRMKLNSACRNKLNVWCWVSYIFPEEKIAWVDYDGRESELSYKLFSYTIEGDEVIVGEPTDVKLTVSVAQINATIADLNSKINEQNEALIQSSTNIQTLTSQVSDLTPYKEKFEKSEQEKVEKELSEKRENLKAYALKSGHISAEEIDTSEDIKSFISCANETAIKAIIAERFMTSLEKVEVPSSVETSIETAQAKASLLSEEEEAVDPKSFIKQFLRKR